MLDTPPGPLGAPTEREKFEFEKLKFNSEQTLKAAAQREEASSRNLQLWRSPLTLAVIGGIITLVASIISETQKSRYTIALENEKFQADLIKKYLEAPDAETRKGNLTFLIESGLIPLYATKISAFVENNKNAAPRTFSSAAAPGPYAGSFGADNLISGITLERLIDAKDAMLSVERREKTLWTKCTGFLIGARYAVTAAYCVPGSLPVGAGELADIRLSGPLVTGLAISPLSIEVAEGIAVITLSQDIPAAKPLILTDRVPRVGERLMLVYSGEGGDFVASMDDECQISTVTEKDIAYRCDASPGSAGGAVISAETGAVVAIHSMQDRNARYGFRMDSLQTLSHFVFSR